MLKLLRWVCRLGLPSLSNMTVNAIFENVKIYSVQDRLDVVLGQTFAIELIDSTGSIEIFTNKDPVLTLSDNDLTVTTSKVGESKLRFMEGDVVVKDLVIVVAEQVGAEASALGLNFGQPENK